MQITGLFETKMTAEPPYSDVDGVALGRASFEKTFHGALEATSHVDMIAARNANQPTSAGYVAIERVTGTVEGRRGTFVLQHNGIMNRGAGSLDCTVVPDSGTGELAGLSGRMKIDIGKSGERPTRSTAEGGAKIDEKQHHYTFDYELTP